MPDSVSKFPSHDQLEADAIRSQFFGTQRRDLTFDDLLEETKTTQQKQTTTTQANFDTESGIQDAGLRALLSGAENKAEEENILATQGFSREDYTRDNRGRLALTPSGARKVGVETDKNVLIDEEGFPVTIAADKCTKCSTKQCSNARSYC